MNQEAENQYLELPTPTGEVIRVLRRSHPQARHLRLTVTSGGARVTCPKGTHPAQVFAFLRKHGEWLERKLDELHLGNYPPALEPGTTTVIPLRGETTRLSWRDGPYPRIELLGDRLQVTLPQAHRRSIETARGLLQSYLDAQLRKDVSRWLALYCPRLGMAPTVIAYNEIYNGIQTLGQPGYARSRDPRSGPRPRPSGSTQVRPGPRTLPSAHPQSCAPILGSGRLDPAELERAARLAAHQRTGA